MISDVLSEAVDQIRAYLDDPIYARVYSGDFREEIEQVVKVMDRMRAKLDQPPPPDAPAPEGG